MTKINLKLVLLSLISVFSILISTVAFNSANVNAETEAESEESKIVLYSSSVPNSPLLAYTPMNTAVKYEWYVGVGGDKLALSHDFERYEIFDTTLYTEYALAKDYFNTNYCDPYYYACKSYDSNWNRYSKEVTLEHVVYIEDKVGIVRYGFESKYSATACLPYQTPNSGSNVPTSYDKGYFIANHNSKKGHRIVGTVWYDGICGDLEVSIPAIGYKSSSVTINGVKFSLRTGPNRCSIKASQSLPGGSVLYYYTVI